MIDFVRARIDKKHADLMSNFDVSGASEMSRFMTTPDSLLTPTLSRASKLPAIIPQ